jgi:Uncharacterized conserved protein
VSFDAILVPGGGVRDHGELPEWVRPRLERAAALQQGEPIILLSAGTPHKPPPLDPHGFPILESRAGAAYLLARGIPASQLLTETASYDTIGNAYFSKVIHVDPRGFRNLLVITSSFHMPRTEAAFRWIYEMGGSAYDLNFEPVPDADLDPASLSVRAEKERSSLASLNALRTRIRTPLEFHRWLFTEHQAYAAATPRRPPADPGLARLY